MNDKNDINNSTDKTAKTDAGGINVVRGAYPFTRYKIAELIVCVIAVVCGLLYLYTDVIGLAVLLPMYALLFAAVTYCRYKDTKALGGHGFAAYLTTACWGFLTVCVAVATAVYFVWY